jgi:hypothetical protein
MSDEEKNEPQGLSVAQTADTLSLRDRLRKHFAEEVDVASGYYPLLICCFVTGLTDGTLYNGQS